MNRNNLIFLGIGVLVAYLIFKPKGAKATTAPETSVDCEKEWDKYWEKNFAHVKMTKEGVEGEKRNFMAKCRGTLTPTPAPSPTSPKKYAYRIKKDIVNGYLPNSNGKPNILFKAGDVVYAGVPFERFLFNKQVKGIEAAPTISGAYIATPNKMHFIPLELLDALATNRV